MDANLLWKLAPFATGALGYIGGILSEPIKAKVKLQQEAEILRYSLYAEIMLNMDVIEKANQSAATDDAYFIHYNPFNEHLQFNCYKHATSDQPIILNRLRENQAIHELYSLFASFTAISRSPENLIAFSEDTHTVLVNAILDRRLDPFLLKKVSRRNRFGQPLWYKYWRSVSKPFRNSEPIFERPKRVALDKLITKTKEELKTKEGYLAKRAALNIMAARKRTEPPPATSPQTPDRLVNSVDELLLMWRHIVYSAPSPQLPRIGHWAALPKCH